jgi:hypothetical protein
MNIKIKYDGDYPNLCSGRLIVGIDDDLWDFGHHCLASGGGVSFDEQWQENVWSGPWTITKWPKDFPNNPWLRKAVEAAVNEQITHGCCGGCV